MTDAPAAGHAAATSPSESRIPDRPALEGLEPKWGEVWESEGTYRFDRDAALAASREQGREAVFGVDTPPPTASGSLHIGHVFSYTHMDLAARFQRMRGKHLFYPMGWDDNGLPTERRVQNYYGVRCDPTLPYEPDFTPPFEGGEGKSSNAADQVPISRRNFIELCERLTVEDEKQFEAVWRALGLSVDWGLTYRTIDDHSRRTAQQAFLNNLARGEAYRAEAPTLWDVSFRTAVAQAELEDREQPGAMHRIAFHRPDGSVVEVDTTRPELIGADVALVAHPDDARYRDLIGTTVTTPLFGAEIPVHAHHLAQPDKGTGIAMVSTWGDVTDVTWWRDLQLPTRAVIGRDGRFLADPEALEHFTDAGRAAYAELAGKTVFSARARTVELLRESGELLAEPSKLSHPVKFFEKGDKPLEVVSTTQWYIANGARDEGLRERLIDAGAAIDFHPDFMRVRYENWVGGLTGDWLISRQRFFGVPLPVWYALGPDGERGAVIVPEEASLPIDPSTDVPPGYDEAQRGQPGGFEGELDIMDTWATSSLTPQIAAHWVDDPELFEAVFPYALRSQGQDIIRTWLFSTVLRAELEHGRVPWRHAGISGFIVDPDRKKMSKSKGNVVTPAALLEEHGSDAVRYWAASSKLGTDAAFDPQNPKQMKIGRRLAIKVLNAAKFVYSFPFPEGDFVADGLAGAVMEPLDLDLLAELYELTRHVTAAYESFDHARALESTEQFFWTFCDDYLELVKERAYGTGIGQASAVATLRLAIDVQLRLLAPVLPFSTEEVWRWTHAGSIHVAPWPTDDLRNFGTPRGILAAVSEALIGIRRAKTDAKASQKTEVTRAVLAGPAILAQAADDLRAVGRIADLEFAEAESIEVREIELAEATA
ncbi:MAG: valine--tRNA ligase [Actinomycetales bacterium]|nr:valine--tRNA ligase [Actinomycetales bacterium]